MAGLGEVFALAATGGLIDNRTAKPDIRNQNNKSKLEKTNTRDMYSSNNSRHVRDSFEEKARSRYRASRNFRDTKIIPRDYQRLADFNNRTRNKVARVENFGNMSDSDSEFSDDDRTFDDNASFASVGSIGSRGSTGSDDGYHGFNMNNPGSVIDRMSSLTNNRKFEACVAKDSKKRRNKFNENNSWICQYDQMTFDNPGDAVSSNNVSAINGKNGNMARIELERQMEIDGGYSAFDSSDDGTYGIVHANSPDFIHENMLPNVRKGPSPIQQNKRAEVNTRKLELFTGSANNPEWRPKTERAPLFSPLIGAQNIYGDPVRTDEFKARYFPGRYRTNELPFQQVKVTPGLDLAYNAVGKHGYNDMYRVVPREAYTNLLRTANNPKETYGSYMGPGQKGEKGPVMGRVVQYKTPRFRERGTKDMVRGRSYITAPTVYGEYDPKNLATVNRGVKETLKQGPAQHYLEGNTPGKYRGNYRASNRENYKYDHPRNIVGHESIKGQGHNNQAFVPDATQRELRSQKGHAHHAEHTGYKAINYEGTTPDVTMREIHPGDRESNVTGNRTGYRTINWNNVPDNTMRNVHDKYDRSGHITGKKEQIRAINWNDTPDPTLRNVHDKYDRSGHVTGNKEQFKAINWNDVPDPTMRNVHNKYDRSGHITGNREQIRAINWNDTPDPNMRNVHDKYDRSGHVTGNKAQYRAINWDDTPDPNMRNVHNKLDRSGHVTGNKAQYRAINWDDTPDPNMRNVHNKLDRSGHVTGNREQYRAINWNDTPDPNMRNVHNKLDRSGNVSGNREQYRAVNWGDVPDPTLRNVHDKYDRSGNVTGNKAQYRAINWDDVPDPNMRNVHDKLDRSGHVTGNREQYRAVNWGDVPDANMRNVHNKLDRSGHVTGNRESYVAVNWNDVPDANMRNIHDKLDRSGHIIGNREQYQAVNWNDVPDTNMRIVHNKLDRSGHVTGNREQHVAVNWNDVPDANMRNIHDKPDRAGHVTGNRESHVAVNWNDVPDVTMRELHPGDREANVTGNRHGHTTVNWNDVPDVTMREMHPGDREANVTGNKYGHKTVDWNDVPDATMREIHPGGRTGGGDSYNKRQTSRHQYMVMKTNGAKEALEDNRAPTKVSMNKGWTIDHTAFEFRDLVKPTWRPAPGSDIMYNNDQLGNTNTKVPVNRFWINDRILAHTEDNLEGNPFVNNLIHKSI